MHTIRNIIGLTVLAMPVAAQSPLARLTVGGGAATDLRGVRSGAYVVAPSVTLFPGRAASLTLAGRGTRFTSQEWSVGGGAALSARISLGGPLDLSISGSADAQRASYRATYLDTGFTPGLEYRAGGFLAWAGVRAAAARSTFEGSSFPAALPGSAGLVLSRSTLGPAFGASLRLAGRGPGESVRLSYREEHGRPDGNLTIDRVVFASVTRGPVALSGSLGRRDRLGENRSYGGGQVSLTVARGVAVFGGAESFPSNPLIGSSAGHSVSAGVSLSTGGSFPAALAPRGGSASYHGPDAIGAPPPQPGLLRLSIAAPRASRVEVAGDWNRWNPIPLVRAANGVWYIDLAIPAGDYRYAFRLDGKTWRVPKGVAAVNDGFGGRSAWLSVRDAGGVSEQSANRKEVP